MTCRYSTYTIERACEPHHVVLYPSLNIQLCCHFLTPVSPEGGVSVEPQVSNTQRGDSVTLSCTVLCGPRNAISWLHPPSDQELSSEPSLSVSVSGGGDGGLYTCSAANEAGNGSADATINGRYRENV